MLSEDGGAVGINFAEGDRSHAGSLESEREASDSTEEVKDIHRLRVSDESVLMAGSPAVR